jgi:hypothetical protein
MNTQEAQMRADWYQKHGERRQTCVSLIVEGAKRAETWTFLRETIRAWTLLPGPSYWNGMSWVPPTGDRFIVHAVTVVDPLPAS